MTFRRMLVMGGGGHPARPDDAAEVAPDAEDARPLDGNVHAEIGGGQRRHSFGASMPPSQHAAVANQDRAARDGARARMAERGHALARQCTQHKPAALGGTHAGCAQWMLAVALQA